MTRWMLVSSVLCLGFAGSALAADSGSAEEAKAMLGKVVASMKADQPGTLARITKGAGEFRDRDLYAFCGGPDGTFSAHGTDSGLVGKSMKQLKDRNGKGVGAAIYEAAREGKVAEVAYVWPRPGSTDPVPKVAFVTRVGDQVCGVGYYP